MRVGVCVIACLVTARLCLADIVGVAGGYEAPPPTLGPYEMTPFPPDDRPLWEWVDTIPSPLGGDVSLSTSLQHKRVGQGWPCWSHGYLGDVYDSAGSADAVTLYLPEETGAFYFYASNWADSLQMITAVTDDGTTIVQGAWGCFAAYFGFYQDDPSGPPIQWIEVSCPSAGMVVVGEFGIAIPGPGAFVILCAGLIGRMRRRP